MKTWFHIATRIALASMLVACATQHNASADLIRHWPFDGNFDEVVAADNGDGVNAPTFAEDRFGTPNGAVSIDGTLLQSVNVAGGGGLDALSTGTIALFVKWSGFQDAACCASSADVTARQSNGVFSNQVIGLSGVDPASSTVTWQPYSAGPAQITGATPVGDGVWRHVAVTWTDGSHVLYIDGVEDGTAFTNGVMNSNPDVPLSIGAWIGDGGGYSTSLIDDLKVFDTVLTEAEVQALLLPPTDIVLTPRVISTAASQGEPIGTLTTPLGDGDDTFSYTLTAGEGDDDNEKFQIAGDELQAGAYDFSGEDDGEEYSLRVLSTGAPSGETFEAILSVIADADSDADGLPDDWELQYTGDDLTILSGLDDADADNDGLTDLQEFNLTQGDLPDLDPTNPDSDGDDLEDGEELAGAGDRPPTDPTDADSDDDSLTDVVETNTGVNNGPTDTGTDPTDPDSDGDGFNDATEILKGSDPNDANSVPGVLLVGYWPFDADTDPQLDLSGFGNDAAVNGTATWAFDADRAGGVMQVADGSTGMQAPHSESLSIDGASGITIAAWVKPTQTSGWEGIIAKNPLDGSGLNHAGNYELRLHTGGRHMEFLWERGTPNSTTAVNDGGNAVLDNVWTHVAFAGEPDGEYTFFVNGTATGTGVMPDNFAGQNTNPLYIGSRADAFTAFDGCLDDVAVFDGLLGEPQIQDIMDGNFADYGIGSASFAITEIVLDETEPSVTLTFTSRTGRTYGVDFSTSLQPGGWTELDDGVESEGDETTYIDTQAAGLGPRIYYRVREVQ